MAGHLRLGTPTGAAHAQSRRAFHRGIEQSDRSAEFIPRVSRSDGNSRIQSPPPIPLPIIPLPLSGLAREKTRQRAQHGKQTSPKMPQIKTAG